MSKPGSGSSLGKPRAFLAGSRYGGRPRQLHYNNGAVCACSGASWLLTLAKPVPPRLEDPLVGGRKPCVGAQDRLYPARARYPRQALQRLNWLSERLRGSWGPIDIFFGDLVDHSEIFPSPRATSPPIRLPPSLPLLPPHQTSLLSSSSPPASGFCREVRAGPRILLPSLFFG